MARGGFLLLMWKNFLLQKRRPKALLFEIALPPLFFAILVAVRHLTESYIEYNCERDASGNLIDPTEVNCDFNSFSPLERSSDNEPLGCFTNEWYLGYYPNTTETDAIMVELRTLLQDAQFNGKYDNVTIMSFINASVAEDTLTNKLTVKGGCKLGVGFMEHGGGYDIDLRFDAVPGGYDPTAGFGSSRYSWETDRSFPSMLGQGPRGGSYMMQGTDDPGYYNNGFLFWQHMLESSVILHSVPAANKDQAGVALKAVQINRYPYPEWLQDGFLFAIQFGFPLLLMLSLFFSVLSITRNVVHEKERKLKEAMKMMGLRSWVHWSAWFCQYLITMLISVIIMSVEIKAGKILKHSDMSLIFLFLVLYMVSTITFCFMVSTFFSKASNAASGAGILWFISYVPSFFINRNTAALSAQEKQSFCFISNTCMTLGANILSQQEGNGAGVTWDTAFDPISVDDSFSFGIVLSMLFFDTILYFIVAWYLEGIFPGEFGIPKPFYFPLMPSYWFPSLAYKNVPDSDCQSYKNDDRFEVVPDGQTAGLDLRNISKKFGEKVAVKGTTLTLFENQITALLGHNGAGKSTTMNMITGLFPPTAGTAVVMGRDIRTDTSGAQNSLGICPQHDVLFDNLTVEEHLRFFCRLKGVASKDIQFQVDDMIASLNLEEKRHVLSKTLSGGQKRRLSCGIAIVGGSKVVILDEPTSGMDPSARRATWDLITKYKAGRTILLSTHFMDEADILGDRIAIMAKGVVQCCGSSLFLKRRFGEGYSLTMAKGNGCSMEKVLAFIQQYIPTATLRGNIGSELTVVLPREGVEKFEGLFEALEAKRDELNLESYGCSITTMEEVFLRVGEEADVESLASSKEYGIENFTKAGSVSQGIYEDDETAILIENGKSSDADLLKPGSMQLMMKQFKAMLIKRMKNSMRDVRTGLWQLGPPLIFTLLALIIQNIRQPVEQVPTRNFADLTSSYGYHSLYVRDDSGIPAVDSALRDLLANSSSQDVYMLDPNENVSNFVIKESGRTTQEIYKFNVESPLILEFTSDGEYFAWFNGQPYHSVAETLSFMNAVIFKRYADGANVSLSASNSPLPKSLNEEIGESNDSFAGFNLAFSILFGMAPVAASFLVFLVKEKETKAKHVQFVSGVGPVSYWLSAYLWDFINFLIPSIGIFVLFFAFSVAEYTSERTGYTVLLFTLFGLSIIPLMYLASFVFTVPSVAFTSMSLFNIITGLAAMLAVTIMQVIPSTEQTAQQLRHVFLFLPNYCFGQGLTDFYTNYESWHFLEKFLSGNPEAKVECNRLGLTVLQCCQEITKRDPDFPLNCPTEYLGFDTPGIGRFVVAMGIQVFVFFVLILAVEFRVFQSLLQMITTKSIRSFARGDLDDDVQREHTRLDDLKDSEVQGLNDRVVLQDLVKEYREVPWQAPEKVAVDGLSVGIRSEECFGLLGVNGAGKTTTFKMMTGDTSPTSGTAYMLGMNIRTNMNQVRQKIGYCPQFDALIDFMTGREILTMFANLRGVKNNMIKSTVNKLIERLTLTPHADKISKGYSGGNKRKLSTAIALVGNPPIVFLDEPTTGMDPGARRFLWDALLEVVSEGRTIVLTSHSMEECEAICTRLGIMVNGQFQCLGSPQHLKSNLGQGVSLTAKVRLGASPEELTKLKTRIVQCFPNAQLREEHTVVVRYTVTSQSWASIFGRMEELKKELDLEDYAVTQATLEQIFLEFAARQVNTGKPKSGFCCGSRSDS
eukprot:m.332943 g.332943  ORF g.332943 m.332943 type:complete len:1731 (+) comp17035_c0_seq1:282-5474(+)